MEKNELEKTLMVIRNYIAKISNFNDADWQFFSSRLTKRVIPKKSTFLKVGTVEDNISFIISGMVRLYIPENDKSKEITFGFSFNEQFVSAYDSFLTRKPSLYELQALEDTTMLTISYENLQKVYQITTIGNLIGRLTAERLFLIKSKREQTLLQNTAEERYLNIFKYQPELIEKIPLKYISSYIGVTPQALSRIRKKIT